MRASWTDIYGRKIVITHAREMREIREMDMEMIEFKNNFYSKPMEVYIDEVNVIAGHNFQEVCKYIDSEIVLSADKE